MLLLRLLWLSVRSEVAILYNDRSVLENHHVSAAYRLMAEEEMNILINLNKDDWRCTHKNITLSDELILIYSIFEEQRALSGHGDWSQMILIVYIDYWQGAEGSGHRDGDVHRHVVPLPADQDHEECPDTDTQVRATAIDCIFSQHACVWVSAA